ncbi:hypothetical protein DACRYDRAFT_20956 [Dacryopinax primogenitus]|uniref:Uncharacterized protein n=1 Tax=Dacryopinax primogenitus (strain DJM 731) TaxID=1858805 RepID=M5G6T7_DACPD|nr:uncharacterized protein DACRYDRAFT_20956 [Dacryopinax primogenitus]EJU04419.1 hypothetical protein DACRYDRAFT_20956 [Dacryopinax primogenitus]
MADRLKAFKIADVEDVSLASLNESAANFLLQKMKGALSGSSLDQPFPMNFKLTYAEVNRAMRIISVPCLSS